MKAHLRYLWYVLRHKWYVFIAGRALGLPLRQLIAHDLSKFSKEEWAPYVAYQGYHRRPQEAPWHIKAAFDRAWEHHWLENPHHPQYWKNLDDCRDEYYTAEPVTMPLRYVAEMVADWYGTGMANGQPDVWAYYESRIAHTPTIPGLDAMGMAYLRVCLGQLATRGLIPSRIEAPE